MHGSKSANLQARGKGVDLIWSYVVDEPLLSTLVVPIRFGDARGDELVLGDVLAHEQAQGDLVVAQRRLRSLLRG